MALREESTGLDRPGGQPAEGAAPRRAWLTTEAVLEGIFLLLVGAVFTYLLVAARKWEAGAALVPTIIGVVGLPLLLIHVVTRVRQRNEAGTERAQILDIGFTDVEQQVARARTIRFLASMAGLFLGIWLVGFHVALPLYVFGYLLRYGQVRWWVALAIALSFEAVLIGLYDRVLHSVWNEPVLWQWLGIEP